MISVYNGKARVVAGGKTCDRVRSFAYLGIEVLHRACTPIPVGGHRWRRVGPVIVEVCHLMRLLLLLLLLTSLHSREMEVTVSRLNPTVKHNAHSVCCKPVSLHGGIKGRNAKREEGGE